MAVLIQENPQEAVIGAETPRIAIYENGDVIYYRNWPGQKQPIYLHAKLGFKGLSVVRDQITLVAHLGNLKRSYSLPGGSDQGRAFFYLHLDDRTSVTSVAGLTPRSLKSASKEQEPSTALEALVKLYGYLNDVEFTESDPWCPAYVEAMIWPYEDGSEKVIIWPKYWPDLESSRASKRPHGWSIFLDGDDQFDLADFLAKTGDKGGVVINGKKWSVASRPAFPSERVWRKAFAQSDDE